MTELRFTQRVLSRLDTGPALPGEISRPAAGQGDPVSGAQTGTTSVIGAD
jgi:hypothetical protein